MDHGGWYDRETKEKDFRKIVDVCFVSAMGFPGGGRAFLTQRVERHYNIMTYTNLGADSTEAIFKTITQKFLNGFDEDVTKQIAPLVIATQAVYNGVELKLKPTPSKSHYTFNLRDMSKIFQGVCAAHNKTVLNKVDLLRLWVHENTRVFGDRLSSQADIDILN
jgi:dynein heavy chain, axonemal